MIVRSCYRPFFFLQQPVWLEIDGRTQVYSVMPVEVPFQSAPKDTADTVLVSVAH